MLHQELCRLPEKYRVPVILCHFEGLTHQEAAQRLRCPAGTLSARLIRARELLRSRLTRRGLAPTLGLSAALTAADVSAAVVPTTLVASTTRAVLKSLKGRLLRPETTSAMVARLVRSELRTMRIAWLKAGAAWLVAILIGTMIGIATARLLNPVDDPNTRMAVPVVQRGSPLRTEPSGGASNGAEEL